jgi:hypothetical protein
LYLKYRTNYALSWHGYEIKVVEFITRILTQQVSYFSDFSTVFYEFLKFTAGNSNKLYITVPRFSTKPPCSLLVFSNGVPGRGQRGTAAFDRPNLVILWSQWRGKRGGLARGDRGLPWEGLDWSPRVV